MSFTEFDLDPKIQAGISACGYKEPTAIQTQAIEPALSGRDVMGLDVAAYTDHDTMGVVIPPSLQRRRMHRRYVDEMRETFEERRNLLLDRFDEMGVEIPTPKGAFYAMPKVPEGFVDACVDRGVIVVPGEAFGDGGAGHARLSYANDTESLREALDVMEGVLTDLRA